MLSEQRRCGADREDCPGRAKGWCFDAEVTPPYPEQFRREAVALVRSSSDRSVPSIAKDLGISGQTTFKVHLFLDAPAVPSSGVRLVASRCTLPVDRADEGCAGQVGCAADELNPLRFEVDDDQAAPLADAGEGFAVRRPREPARLGQV